MINVFKVMNSFGELDAMAYLLPDCRLMVQWEMGERHPAIILSGITEFSDKYGPFRHLEMQEPSFSPFCNGDDFYYENLQENKPKRLTYPEVRAKATEEIESAWLKQQVMKLVEEVLMDRKGY